MKYVGAFASLEVLFWVKEIRVVFLRGDGCVVEVSLMFR